jgi:hypothetical protein
MALFTIKTTETNIDAPFLKEPSRLELVDVDEHTGQFFQCNHTNLPLVRLLVPLQYGRAQSAMSKTDIFMTLKKLKDVEWHKTLAAANINDKDVRYKDKHVRLKVLQFPSTVEITAPNVGDVRGMTLTVALNKPRLGVVMLLSTAVLEYLRSVVSFQLATGVDKTNRKGRNEIEIDRRVDTRVVNLFWSYDKDKYRAIFFPVDHNGKRMPRTQLHTRSLEEAKHFLETGDRPEKRIKVASVGKGDTRCIVSTDRHSVANESSDEDGESAAMSEDDAEDEAPSSENIERSSPSIEAREDGGSPSVVV